jgi:uncharacterized protein involved in response to NO
VSIAFDRAKRRGATVFLSQGFRPFFLAAGLWSAGALAIWILVLAGKMALPSRFDPLTWHIHEMLFGFVMAAVAGFLLTAIPNWTGRLPISGPPLGGLAALWLLGRVACLISAMVPAWLAIIADLAFPTVLALAAAREIVAGKNWRNLPMIASLMVLGTANLLMHLEAIGIAVPFQMGWRLAIFAVVVLISVVGGRIIPSFTRNWLVRRGAAQLPSSSRTIERAALGTLHGGMLLWVFLPDFWLSGVVLVIGAVANILRLAGWRGSATRAEPLLLILHVGYGWLVAGTGLLGLSVLTLVPESAAIHALTAGAFGTMILAMMTRVTRGHSGRDLAADGITVWIYLLITAAAIVRVVAGLRLGPLMLLFESSAGLWIAAFLLFVLRYGSMLLLPRVRA